MPVFLSTDELARGVLELTPRWGNAWSLANTIKAFEEAERLRPLFRAFLPPRFKQYHTQKWASPEDLGLTEDETTCFEAIEAALFGFHQDTESFEPKLPWPDPPDVLRPYIRGPAIVKPTTAELTAAVGVEAGSEALATGTPYVLSFYGDWQRLRLWTLIEAYTYIALLDPRKAQPGQIGMSRWENDLQGRVRAWTLGDGRMAALVAELERGGWLADLYQAGRALRWGGQLLEAPETLAWSHGCTLTPEARWEAVRNKVQRALEPAARKWRPQFDEFARRTRQLLELWKRASDAHANALSQLLHDDLETVGSWADFLFGLDLDELDARVGRQCRNDLTLLHVLRPGWRRARDIVDRWLPQFVDPFNQTMSPASLATGDVTRFLEFLDQHQLGVWHMELAEIIRGGPSDTRLDHRFVHLRSLLLLGQPIVAALAERYGNTGDRNSVLGPGTKDPMKAFIAGRSDWRQSLAQSIGARWTDLTQTRGGTRLEDRLAEIMADVNARKIGGAAGALLTFAAVRNFGGHRFSNDPALLVQWWGRMLSAAILTPLFYWKLATANGH